jgi:hypothetical protein
MLLIQALLNLTGGRLLIFLTLILSSRLVCLTLSNGKRSWSISSTQSPMKFSRSKCKNGISREDFSQIITLLSPKSAMQWSVSPFWFSHVTMTTSKTSLTN